MCGSTKRDQQRGGSHVADSRALVSLLLLTVLKTEADFDQVLRLKVLVVV